MKAYLNTTSHDAYAVCPKCGERIEFTIGAEALGTKIALKCMACDTLHDGVLVVHTSGRTDIASEMVNHPDHYQSETGLEVIDVIEAFTFDLRGIEAFNTGNIIKYICR